MKVVKELCEKSFWLSVTTRDLYYWIEVLNKVDSILETTIEDIRKLSNGTERCTDQQEFENKYSQKCEKLTTLLIFSTNLLRESSSRSIYNSVDVSIQYDSNYLQRLIDVLKEVDNLNVIYLALETVYTLIRKSCLTGKFTKAHESKDHDLLRIVYMYSIGINYLSDKKLDLVQSMDLEKILSDRSIKLQRFKKMKIKNREVPTLSYFTLPFSELESLKLPDNKPKTSRNIATHLEQQNELGEGYIEPLAMKTLFALKLSDMKNVEENLVAINKVMFKAKSVFIQLSAIEENKTHYTLKFVKEYPFNEFIPDILSFCTLELPSTLH